VSSARILSMPDLKSAAEMESPIVEVAMAGRRWVQEGMKAAGSRGLIPDDIADVLVS